MNIKKALTTAVALRMLVSPLIAIVLSMIFNMAGPAPDKRPSQSLLCPPQ